MHRTEGKLRRCTALRIVWKVGDETLNLKFDIQNPKSNNFDFRMLASEFKYICPLTSVIFSLTSVLCHLIPVT